MPEICWNPSLNIGVADIDEQHEKLTGLINELYQSYAAGRAKEIITRIIGELSDYACYHFGTEEKLMVETGYPERDVHVAQHRVFMEKTIGFLVDTTKGEEELSTEVLDYLTDWWLGHIRGTDMRLAAFLKEKGKA